MKKLLKISTALVIIALLNITTINYASAQTQKVMWGKTELKIGQIGKVTILKDTNLVKLNSDGSLSTVRKLNKGDEFRVYQYKGQHGGLYGVGSSSFVQKDTAKVLYETPSKSKLELVVVNQQVTLPAKPVDTPKVSGKISDVVSTSTLKYMSDNNYVIEDTTKNTIAVDVDVNSNYYDMVVFDVGNGNPEIRFQANDDSKVNTKASKIIHLLLKDSGYSVTEAKIKSYIDTYLKTGLTNTKITGNLYIQENGGSIYIYVNK